MKNRLTNVFVLIGCVLCASVTPTVLANHRSGDFALPEIIRMADFDGDGIQDLAVNVSGFDHIVILKGDGHANFTVQGQFETDTLPKGVAMGDFDKDGRLDLATIQEWGYNIKVNLGDGLGGFTFVQELNGDGEPTRLYAADLNNDGNLDLIGNAPQEGNVLIYYGNGKGGFATAAAEIENHPNCQAIGIGDFNGDGNSDLAIAYYEDKTSTGSHTDILLGDGTGNFTSVTQFQTNPEATNAVPVDINGDGLLDLLLSGAGAENDQGVFLQVFLGDGTGKFTNKQTLDLGTGTVKGDMALADINEDGKLDVVLPISSLGDNQGGNRTMCMIFLGDGTGNFLPAKTATVGREPHTAVASDFDGDGHIDLVVSNRTDGTVTVLLGTGLATFTTHATIKVNAPPQGAAAPR
jgi:FG-GAP-like repeat